MPVHQEHSRTADRKRAEFIRDHPAYAQTGALDDLRRTEFARLDRAGHTYLDYTGGGLYADSQIREHFSLLESGVYGNPHSLNPTSAASTTLLEKARDAVLRHFNAAPSEYAAIFTPNATGALRIVGESYPFHPGGPFLLTFDNHNSVNGIREYARARGATTTYIPSVAPELRTDENILQEQLRGTPGRRPGLFAYPAQSNFSGVQHPLGWIQDAHERGWDVLLDAAAFVPTNGLDLHRYQPDFVALSFYKMFGWPTGIGCLIARHEALAKLQRPWFSGGTIVAVFVQREYHRFAEGPAHFEDGTLDYLNIPAVEIGLRFIENVGMDKIHTRVALLTQELLHVLTTLRHRDGSPVATVYGPTTGVQRGGTVAFNFQYPDGRIVDERYVDRVASSQQISLRTGCFCNPGAGEVALSVTKETLARSALGASQTLQDYITEIGMPSGGAVRASLGLASNIDDVLRFGHFAQGFVDLADVPDDLPPRLVC